MIPSSTKNYLVRHVVLPVTDCDPWPKSSRLDILGEFWGTKFITVLSLHTGENDIESYADTGICHIACLQSEEMCDISNVIQSIRVWSMKILGVVASSPSEAWCMLGIALIPSRPESKHTTGMSNFFCPVKWSVTEDDVNLDHGNLFMTLVFWPRSLDWRTRW